MNIHQRALQILILVVLVQVFIVIFVYITKIWPRNLVLFPHAKHKKKVGKEENIFWIWKESNNPTLNLFTKQQHINDEKRLVNLIDFDYKIKKENVCNNERVLLFVAVSSAPGNQLRRQVIRDTWGQQDTEVKIVFMLGDTNSPNDTKRIEIENMTFNDIVQGNFLDSYKNMTYKITMGLKYAIYNCPTAKFLLKCDDDVLINMPLLKNFLKNDMLVINPKNSIFCTVNNNIPIRDLNEPLSKWYVSYEEWPEERYPLYCAGWYFIMTLDVAFNIYQHAQRSTFFWIDDVFLTGIAAKNIQELKYVNMNKFTLARKDVAKILNGDIERYFLTGSPNMKLEDIRKLWEYIVLKPVQESVLESCLKVLYQK